jgi:Tfp pilus assembly protein PilF
MSTGLSNQKTRKRRIRDKSDQIEIDDKYRDIVKLLSKKKFSQARRLAEKVGKSDANYLCDVAILFARLGINSNATHLFKNALEVDPKNSFAHYNYGLFLKSQKKFKEAELEFKKAIKYDNSIANYYSMLGNVLLDQNMLDDAEEQFDLALDLDSKNLFALTGLGNISLTRGDLQEAEKIFKYLIKLDKTYPVSYLSLLMLYNKLGRQNDAKKIIKLAEKAKLKISIEKNNDK